MACEPTPEVMAALNAFVGKFVVPICRDPTNPPDLHAVLIEAPAPGLIPTDRLPRLSSVRPDLAGKSWLHRRNDTIPLLPATRVLFVGDGRWFDYFLTLSREVVEFLRANDPEVGAFLLKAGWEESLISPNVWPLMVRDIAGWADGYKGFMRKWRWGEDQWNPLLPYDDGDLNLWLESEKARGGKDTEAPSKDLNVLLFTANVFEASADAVGCLLRSLETRAFIPPTTCKSYLEEIRAVLRTIQAESDRADLGLPGYDVMDAADWIAPKLRRLVLLLEAGKQIPADDAAFPGRTRAEAWLWRLLLKIPDGPGEAQAVARSLREILSLIPVPVAERVSDLVETAKSAPSDHPAGSRVGSKTTHLRYLGWSDSRPAKLDELARDGVIQLEEIPRPGRHPRWRMRIINPGVAFKEGGPPEP